MPAAPSHERSRTLDEMFRGNRWVIVSDEALAWEERRLRIDSLQGCFDQVQGLAWPGDVRDEQIEGMDLLDQTKPEREQHVAGRREQLPAQAVKYVRRIEELVEAPVTLLSTSPERDDTILMRDPFEG